jgi:hypothetical protein
MIGGEWAACTDPTRMLEFLGGTAGERQLRLFVCAFCRWNWDTLPDERSRRAVETSERFTEELATREQLAAAFHDAMLAKETSVVRAGWGAAWLGWVAQQACAATLSAAELVLAARHRDEWLRKLRQEQPAVQCDLLRDVFGPAPFRPILLDPSWRTPAVVALATAVYEERRFEEMPVLADALEESGCDSQEILGHLRQQEQTHARGCWLLDLLLNKG